MLATVVRIAMPAAMASWRPDLNKVEAASASAGLLVANVAAFSGTRLCPWERPSRNIRVHIHHGLVPVLTGVISAAAAATPRMPMSSSGTGTLIYIYTYRGCTQGPPARDWDETGQLS